jgi:hypothetical protein
MGTRIAKAVLVIVLWLGSLLGVSWYSFEQSHDLGFVKGVEFTATYLLQEYTCVKKTTGL